jgi:hypothetical protein
MTPEEFLQNLLKSQDLTLDEDAILQSHKDEVTKFLRAEFGSEPDIKYAGSYRKGTMIRENYDLDIVAYFPSTDERTLKEIHDDVLSRLKEKYDVEEKASAIRITDMKDTEDATDYHIDVVPGRFIEDSKDVFLYVVDGDKERIQTNLKTHIEYITNSRCADVIRLVKLWAHRNDISVRTFVLELFVVESLSGSRNKSDLKTSFLQALSAFKEDFQTKKLIDPANSGNVVSDLLHPSILAMVTEAAGESLAKIAESDEVTDWEAIFHEGAQKGSSSDQPQQPRLTKISNPSGQWAK